MARHRLPATPVTARLGYLQAGLPPVLHIRPGDRVTVETLPSGRSREYVDFPFPLLPAHHEILASPDQGPGPHIVTGPIQVDGAEPGDAVEIEIVRVRVRQPWGWNGLWPGKGALPNDFDTGRVLPVPIDLVRRQALMPWGQRLRLRPFFGFLATAPSVSLGRVSTVEPREFGGNLDNRDLVPGARLQLPVFSPGAGIFIGDGHALQGDGEVTQTALEASLEGTVVVRLIKGAGLTRPRAITPKNFITMGFHPDLDLAAELALRDMVRWITARTALSADHAFTLFGLVGELRVTQVVDGNKGVHAVLPKTYLNIRKAAHASVLRS